MSWWNWPLPDEWFESEEGGVQTIGTMSPEQQSLMAALGPWLQSRIGQGLPGWEGAFTAPLSEYEQTGMGLLGDYIGGGIGDTAEMGLGAYQQALQGLSPEQVHQQYMKYTAPAEARYLKEQLIPTFKESMVPGGALRSTGTERGIGDIVSKFGEGQMGRIGERITSERAGARSMLPYLSQMSSLEGGMPQIEAALQYGQIPRMIEQAELQAQIQEFIRTTPELSPILNQMQQFLGHQTMAAYNQPFQPSPFMQFLGAVAPGVGSGIGAAIAASDVRLKKNIRWLGRTLSGLNIYKWEWRDWAEKLVGTSPTIGMLAQEVMKIIPDAVSIGTNGYLQVNYSKVSNFNEISRSNIIKE